MQHLCWPRLNLIEWLGFSCVLPPACSLTVLHQQVPTEMLFGSQASVLMSTASFGAASTLEHFCLSSLALRRRSVTAAALGPLGPLFQMIFAQKTGDPPHTPLLLLCKRLLALQASPFLAPLCGGCQLPRPGKELKPNTLTFGAGSARSLRGSTGR